MFKQMKALIALPVVILTISFLTGMAYGEEIKIGVINADSVNIREAPATTSKIVMQLSKESKIVVIEKQEDWYKIGHNDSTGYVFGNYVTLKDVVIDSGIIKGTNVNVRSKPDTDSEILTRLNNGDKLDIYEYSGSWARISITEGRFGWVYKDFIVVKSKAVSRDGTAVARAADELTVQDGNEKAVQADNVQAGQADNVPVKADENQASQADNTQTEKPAVKDIRQQIVEYAKKFLGVKYVYGGSSSKGFDCSGFTSYVFKQFGISLERTSTSQGSHGTKINRSDLKPGDLVFFDTNGGLNAINHVGMYIGGGKFIHASSGSGTKCVTISDMTEGFYNKSYMRSRRYIKD